MPNPYKATRRGAPLPPRDDPEGRPLRALAHVHMYPPGHNAGAELMLHTMLRDLVRRGWEVLVVATDYRGQPYERDGVSVEKSPIDADLDKFYAWADVAVTHLDATRRAIAWARRGRPLVHVVHNHRQLVFHRVHPENASLVVFNSEWIADAYKDWPGPSMIVRPPVFSADYATTNRRRFDRGAATLLNLAEAKGGDLLWRLALQRPDLRFVGVRGSYAGQVIPDVLPPNGAVVPNTPHVTDIYGRTRVLLVPSSYESWGRVAVEAMASGIPVIAHPTDGLVEALTSPVAGACAIFADRDSDEEWLTALRSLDDRATWDRWSELSTLRSHELDQVAADDLDAFAYRLTALAVVDTLAPAPA